MAKPITDLPKDLNKLSEMLITNSEKRQREVALDLYAGLTRVNPKKTGRSAGSWQIGIGQAVRLVSEPPADSSYSAQAFVSKRAATEISKLARPISADINTIHITSIIEYMGALNAGYSKQAPAMWIENEIARVAKGATNVKLIKVTN